VRPNVASLFEVHPDVWLLDTGQFGAPGQGAIYILRGKRAAIVESGTSLARERVLGALAQLAIPREDVAWIFLTHIHLDHAGGAGGLLQELPAAKAVVHERGARHLLEPSRLLASVQAAVRDRFPLYGTMSPIPADRLHVAYDGELFAAGGSRIQAVDSPGHAPHHLCYFAEGDRLLFTGDATGLYLSGKLLPSTAPPSFDLDLSLATLGRLAALRPEKLLYTHFGTGSPDLLAQYAGLLRSWVERVARLRAGAADEDELVARVLGEAAREGLPTDLARGDLAMSVRGVVQYLAQREGTT